MMIHIFYGCTPSIIGLLDDRYNQYKGRFKRSEFLFQNVRISGYVNTESIWSLQT